MFAYAVDGSRSPVAWPLAAAIVVFGAATIAASTGALRIAIVIDATLGRLVLLPAALHLAGRGAWWTPNLAFEDSNPMPAKLAWAAPVRSD